MMDAMSSKGTANMSWSTNASRSDGPRVSSTTSSAAPTESANTASYSGSVMSTVAGTSSPVSSPPGSSRLAERERSMSRHTRDTTVVSQPPRFWTSLTSVRCSRNHASCTASSASLAEPSMR